MDGSTKAPGLPLALPFLAVLLLTPLAGPSAAARVEPFVFEGRFEVQGTSVVSGQGDLVLSGPAMLSDPAAPGLRLALDMEAGRVVVRNHPRETAGTSGGGPLGRQEVNLRSLPPEDWMDRPFTGRAEVLEALRPAWYRVVPLDGGDLRLRVTQADGLSFAPPVDLSGHVPPGAIADEYAGDRFVPTSGQGSLVSSADGFSLRPEGAVVVALYGARVGFDGAGDGQGGADGGGSFEIRSEPAINGSRSVSAGPGTAGYTIEDRPVVYLYGVRSIEVAGRGLQFLGQRVDGSWTGDLAFGQASMQATVNGTQLRRPAALAQAIGDFSVAADLRAEPATWDLRGAATFVALDAQTVAGARDGHLTLVVAAGAVGLVALAFALAAKGSRLLAFIPGLNVAEPLGNPQRVEVLAAIARAPGIDQSELSSQVGSARGTVRHHLRILQRADLVTERRLGARATYTLNDSSYEFRATAGRGGDATAAQAFALLRQPQRRALFGALKELGEADYERLRGHLGGDGKGRPLARDMVSYHLGLLEQAGIVARRREGRRILWKACMDVGQVTARQRERFLAFGRLQDLLHAVPVAPRQAADPESIAQVVAWKGPRRALAARLDLLAATGFVERAGDGFVRRQPTTLGKRGEG